MRLPTVRGLLLQLWVSQEADSPVGGECPWFGPRGLTAVLRLGRGGPRAGIGRLEPASPDAPWVLDDEQVGPQHMTSTPQATKEGARRESAGLRSSAGETPLGQQTSPPANGSLPVTRPHHNSGCVTALICARAAVSTGKTPTHISRRSMEAQPRTNGREPPPRPSGWMGSQHPAHRCRAASCVRTVKPSSQEGLLRRGSKAAAAVLRIENMYCSPPPKRHAGCCSPSPSTNLGYRSTPPKREANCCGPSPKGTPPRHTRSAASGRR